MPIARRPRTTRALLALTALCAAATAACGADDDAAGPSGTTTTTPSAQRPIEVTAVDYAFENLPAELAAGTELTLRNDSEGELHELVAMRLPDHETRPADALLALPEQELNALFAGPPALVLIAPPDEGGFAAVGDGRLVEPGRYLVACFIPTGADPGAYLGALEANPGQPPSVPGGPPHLSAGMYEEVTVR